MDKNYELRQNFGELVKRIRISRKLTQSKLAEMVEVDAKHISCIENGLSFPSIDLLAKIAETFEMPIYNLFMFESKPTSDELRVELEELIKNASEQELEKIYIYSKFITAK